MKVSTKLFRDIPCINVITERLSHHLEESLPYMLIEDIYNLFTKSREDYDPINLTLSQFYRILNTHNVQILIHKNWYPMFYVDAQLAFKKNDIKKGCEALNKLFILMLLDDTISTINAFHENMNAIHFFRLLNFLGNKDDNGRQCKIHYHIVLHVPMEQKE